MSTTPNVPGLRTPEDALPWAMQIALRVEKTDPPSDVDAFEAAARACVDFIAEAHRRAATGAAAPGGRTVWADVDERSDSSDPSATSGNSDEALDAWLTAYRTWRGVAIRKIVRRCRGKRWDDAQSLAGVSVTQGRAEARAFVPAPVRPLPPELAKMQVEGTDLPAGESTTEDAFVTIRISPLITMTSGKTAAQCAHAAQRAWESMDEDARARWAESGHRVRVVRDTEQGWAATPGRVSIVDAGFTELDGQHETTRADW